MASKKIEDRTKWLGGPWDVIKGKNPDLTKGGLFKPPMDPLVNKYDKDKDDYGKLDEKKKQLKGLVTKMIENTRSDNAESGKLHDAFDKAQSDEQKAVEKCFGDLEKYAKDDADPKDVMAAMTSLGAALENFNGVRKAIVDKLTSLNTSHVAQIKKDAADFKNQADALDNATKKLEADMNSLDDQIRKLVQTYQQIAIKNKKEEVSDAVHGLLDFL
jgi:chromosome segregation ATPase